MNNEMAKKIKKEVNKEMQMVVEAQSKMFDLHNRTMACFCECLAMNAENSYAVCQNQPIPYNDAFYFGVMQKWGIMNDKGEPLI
jgi:hypothetical protein